MGALEKPPARCWVHNADDPLRVRTASVRRTSSIAFGVDENLGPLQNLGADAMRQSAASSHVGIRPLVRATSGPFSCPTCGSRVLPRTSGNVA